VTLRVVGGDEKGSLKSETEKYGHEPEGTKLARASSIYKRQTRHLVTEGAPEKQARNGAGHRDLLTDRQSHCDFDFESEG
jgi:hypothetical protein